MSNAICGNGGCSSALMGCMNGAQRPDPSKMANSLFSKLDTKGQGYIEKGDLQSALDQIPAKKSSGAVPSADDIFQALDNDGDGKVTQQEMSDSVTKLVDQLNSQLQNMRMGGKGGGMSKSDPGSRVDGADRTAQMLNSLTQNFDAADTDHDGKVSTQEAMAYQASSEITLSSAEAQSSEARVMARIMDLMATYGAFSQDEQATGGTISTMA